VTIQAAGDVGDLILPDDLVSYPGVFVCTADGRGRFNHATTFTAAFTITLGSLFDTNDTNTFTGTIILRSAPFPNLVSCFAEWTAERQ
jgi:hypothetical protein